MGPIGALRYLFVFIPECLWVLHTANGLDVLELLDEGCVTLNPKPIAVWKDADLLAQLNRNARVRYKKRKTTNGIEARAIKFIGDAA